MNQTPWKDIQNKLRNPDEPENELLKNWLEDQENQTVLDDLKVIYSITGKSPDSFIPQKELAWQNIIKRIYTPKHKLGIIRIMLRIAASILLFALGVGSSYYLQNKPVANSFTEVYSPYGHKTSVLLPDGSQIWLNGDSKIKYNTDFIHSRNVELTGEALFKVTKNPHSLFTVKAEKLKLEVYGTTFNVKSYPEELTSEIALIEGSLGLFSDKQMLKKMVPGEVISYNSNDSKLSVGLGNIEQIISWRADELVIENESFENVIKYLERWYGIEITVDKSLEQSNRLSFKVKTESLIELLSIINHITPVIYEINGKQVKISKPNNSKK